MDLFSPVEELNGVGPKTADVLKKSGIKTIRDFFYNLPRDYDDFGSPIKISEIRPGKVIIKGKIDKISTRKARRRNMSVTEAVISDNTGSIKTIWFNQGYRARQFVPEKEYYFTGNYEFKNGRYSLISPSATLATDAETSNGIQPIYVAHGKLKSNDFRRLMNLSRNKFALIPDFLPNIKSGKRREALFTAHFPNSIKSAQDAREYLAYEELFELILAARLNKSENEKLKASPIDFDLEKIQKFLTSLPFSLTDAQKKAAWEIFNDMMQDRPMNRLLQGDVGSGKTMVAALAAYEAINSGVQVAIMAPTAILATQHYNNLKKLLEPFKITVALLIGATKDKKTLKTNIENGKINLVIGTHALITEDTNFLKLGLVIIDEQHRFGVEQRRKLALKTPTGLAPHLLSMTATPIPRSLQLTVFGDLDISILNQLPKGRKPITTTILPEIELKEKLYPKIMETVTNKNQIYWICKTIDQNAGTEATSVKSRAAKLKTIFPKLRIEFLHGKMKPAEKDEVMKRFSENKVDILVSTTVVEVGVDVPNASLMVIENAENYGLAQIHQLRGRVGRGDAAASCYLVTSGDMRPSKRLRELEKSTDGFYLAEVDLKMRGPGEIYGVLQHGALDLRIASLSDTKLIHLAQKNVNDFLQNPKNMLKYRELMRGISKYQQITTLN